MGVREEAIAILQQCEEDLRSLLAEASAKGDYETVMWLATTAQQIHRIAGRNQAESDEKPDLPRHPAKSTKTNRDSKKPDYPRYTRLNGTVIKTGWSKRSKNEYRHKAPQTALQAVADAALLAGAEGKVFAGGDVVSDLVDSTGQSVPDYQGYLCLGLLKQLGLLDQHGRTGYSIPRPERLVSSVQNAFKQLPLETPR